MKRFWEKAEVVNECWLWTAATTRGYGAFCIYDGKNVYAHRQAFFLTNGYLTPGLQIDHLCRKKLCINPLHLEEVTQQVNLQRSRIGRATTYKKSPVCHRGHLWTEANTYIIPSTGGRLCRICIRSRTKEYSMQQK